MARTQSKNWSLQLHFDGFLLGIVVEGWLKSLVLFWNIQSWWSDLHQMTPIYRSKPNKRSPAHSLDAFCFSVLVYWQNTTFLSSDSIRLLSQVLVSVHNATEMCLWLFFAHLSWLNTHNPQHTCILPESSELRSLQCSAPGGVWGSAALLNGRTPSCLCWVLNQWFFSCLSQLQRSPSSCFFPPQNIGEKSRSEYVVYNLLTYLGFYS